MDIITLHRDANRDAVLSRLAERPLFFDATLKAWVVSRARDCEALLMSPNLLVSPYGPAYEDMARRNPDYAFPNLIFAFKYIPMCLNDEEHKASRRRFAEYIASRKQTMTAIVPQLIERWFGGLQPGQTVELMTEAIEPLVKDVLGALNGTDAEGRALIRSASAVFDRMMGWKRRRELDDELAKMRRLIRKALGPEGSEEDEGMRLSLFILGNDALAGSFGESLHRIFVANRGRKLSEINYPTTPTATSVAFVERFVGDAFEYGGVALGKGERLRFMLQSFEYSADPSDRLRMFGAGIHVCLGRQLSLDVWSKLVEKLSRIDARVDVLDYELRDEDYVFTHPSRLSIALSA